MFLIQLTAVCCYRGLAGTVLVYKIAGALAERGGGLDEVHNVAEWVSKNVGTIGVGLEHCHVSLFNIVRNHQVLSTLTQAQVPGTAAAQSHLSGSEIEIGMGIHNEPGNRRLSPIPPLNELVKQLLENVMSTTDPERSFIPFKGNGDKVVLLVNNLGGVSELELGGLVSEATNGLQERGAIIERVISGTFMVCPHNHLKIQYSPLADKLEYARFFSHGSFAP